MMFKVFCQIIKLGEQLNSSFYINCTYLDSWKYIHDNIKLYLKENNITYSHIIVTNYNISDKYILNITSEIV